MLLPISSELCSCLQALRRKGHTFRIEKRLRTIKGQLSVHNSIVDSMVLPNMAKVFDCYEEDGRDEFPAQDRDNIGQKGTTSELHRTTRPQQCGGKLNASKGKTPCTEESVSEIEKSLMVFFEGSCLPHNDEEQEDTRKQVDLKNNISGKGFKLHDEDPGTRRGRFLVVPFPGGHFRRSFDLAAFGSSCSKRR